MKRRSFLLGGAAVVASTQASYAQGALAFFRQDQAGEFKASRRGTRKVPKQFLPQRVNYQGKEPKGTIIIETSKRFLYLTEGNGKAMRYGIGVGREGFAWSGRANVRRKAEWPTWTPPPSMIKRQPELAKYRAGMPGGPANPLGARALYLYRGGRDTLYRIHGTNEPWTIGTAVSSGCIRMVNEDVEDLYSRIKLGARVIVRA